MKSTERISPVAPAPMASDMRFAQLRDAFRVRLRQDGIELIALGVALVRGRDDPAQTFDQIRRLAHRMRGAAAVFDAPDILDASGVLEDATILAASTHTSAAAASVCMALATLMTCVSATAGDPS